MAAEKYAIVNGKKLAALRRERSLSQRELADAAELSESAIQAIERKDRHNVYLKSFKKIAAALNMTPDELRVRICAPSGRPADPEFPSGIKGNQQRPAKIVPEFNIGIAASRRVEKNPEHPDAHRPVHSNDTRVFAAPVDGDCQSPKYKNGEIVVFSYDAVAREGLIEGRSYYVQFADGSSTFKRVFFDEKDPEIYILRAWNAKKYPKEIRVHKDEVVRVARAVAKQTDTSD